ncbi:hypothetical protein UVI_02022360 [Ustilaginoidea virens]|uniref:Aminoglycoside phosphotransferase domain-containing protein n=1 Tax=Ustilaginoidea virens TaxID=1159556 RepID=A0A1B5L1U1_USTVR|nr:hypothetical protein UVI_02022360 [Ustilaginoidea virens]
MPDELMTHDEAVSALLAFVFSGAIGSSEGKSAAYSLVEATSTTFSWWVALENMDGPAAPVNRYRIEIDRQSKRISPPRLIEITDAEMSDAILQATVTVHECPGVAYVVQLRHHGNVASMDALMTLISRTVDPQLLPVPPVFSIPGEKERQSTTGMGRQITQLIPGDVAWTVYPLMPHDEKLIYLRRIALAFQACWGLPLPTPRLIGELVATTHVDGKVLLSVGPDRHHSLGGPFSSVRDYLKAHVRSALVRLEKQQGIDDYKERFLDRVRNFVDGSLHNIPAIVERMPIVAMHADMGPHNIIVSSSEHSDIKAIIDWEFVASAPFMALHRIIEMHFRQPAENGYGREYDRADELREAFWGAIPEWKVWNEDESTLVFLEWFRFGLFLRPEWRPNDLPVQEAEEFWRENIRVVEGILLKYS